MKFTNGILRSGKIFTDWSLKVYYKTLFIRKQPSRIADIPWTRLDLDEFACTPSVTSVREIVRGYSGRNVTVACTARASPSADVFWEVKDKPLSNRSFLPLSGKQEHVSDNTSIADFGNDSVTQAYSSKGGKQGQREMVSDSQNKILSQHI